jgi:hypothetical protein
MSTVSGTSSARVHSQGLSGWGPRFAREGETAGACTQGVGDGAVARRVAYGARYTHRVAVPVPMLAHVIVVLGRTLEQSVKMALVRTGVELPMSLVLEEPVDRGDRYTHRINVAPDEREDGRVRVALRGRDSEKMQAERTVRWHGNPERTDELITAIRELAGLDAA